MPYQLTLTTVPLAFRTQHSALRIRGTKVLASNHQNNQIAHPHELSILSLYRRADAFRAAGTSCSEL